jgi:UPF0176 protein
MQNMALYNLYDKHTLRKKLEQEPFGRKTVSFYRYVITEDPSAWRDILYAGFEELGVLGRIYVAREGINAQVSVPEPRVDDFIAYLNQSESLKNIPLKWAVEDDGKSFLKLVIKVRKKIVADGLDDNSFDVTNVGKHLNAQEFNSALEDPGTIVVDMRNHYETEVGRFENAVCPDVDTFKEELPAVLDMLKGKEDKKVLMYCTGGIRCEKASAYLRHHGFSDVNQLHGGIIDYVRQIKQQGIESKFKGKNFVFDQRMGERITNDILSECHQCGTPCDTHTNCANDACHLLFIQCENCSKQYNGCCCNACKEFIAMPIEKQRALRKGPPKKHAHAVHKSRLRPNLKDILKKEREE